MAKKRNSLHPDEPLRHPDHPRPVTRRDFIRQGFMTGGAAVLTGGVFSLFANPRAAYAVLSDDIKGMVPGCLGSNAAGKIPFICFDLAGGANMAGSNVLGGQAGDQLNFLNAAGYIKMGLPSTLFPGAGGANINTELGLAFHPGSQFLEGIRQKALSVIGTANISGAIIPSRSANDTGTNPHNPMYAIAMAGAEGDVVTLIGSRTTQSGGNSIAPASLVDPTLLPTKVDRPSDVTGMVDVGDLLAILNNKEDVVAVMESMVRLTDKKIRLGTINANKVIQDLVRCGYISTADIADHFADVEVDPAADTRIVGPAGIFTQAEFNGDSEFRKTASVMKMVIDGHAGAGTITMGGYDYHTGDRVTGEARDLRAGRCMGACLEYASRVARPGGGFGIPLMIYVFSDGSVFSNGTVDGTGKGVWTGDDSSPGASFFLVFDPDGISATYTTQRQQIGSFSADGSVVTTSSPAANNVNLLVNTVMLNYMALNGDVPNGDFTNFTNLFQNRGLNHGLVNLADQIAFVRN